MMIEGHGLPPWLLRLAVIAVIVGNLSAFALAIRTHFTRPDGMTTETRNLVLAGGVASILLIGVHGAGTLWIPWRVATGLGLCATSAWLFAASLRVNRHRPLSVAGSVDAPMHLNRAGPYARVRHPFYTSYLLTWVGAGIISPHWWALLPAVLMGLLYWRHARAEEGKFLAGSLADEYRRYRQVAGMFWPRVWGRPSPGGAGESGAAE